MPKDLKKEITTILNRACRENKSNTPDFILAKFMLSCLKAGENLINEREKYYGVHTNLDNYDKQKKAK